MRMSGVQLVLTSCDRGRPSSLWMAPFHGCFLSCVRVRTVGPAQTAKKSASKGSHACPVVRLFYHGGRNETNTVSLKERTRQCKDPTFENPNI